MQFSVMLCGVIYNRSCCGSQPLSITLAVSVVVLVVAICQDVNICCRICPTFLPAFIPHWHLHIQIKNGKQKMLPSRNSTTCYYDQEIWEWTERQRLPLHVNDEEGFSQGWGEELGHQKGAHSRTTAA